MPTHKSEQGPFRSKPGGYIPAIAFNLGDITNDFGKGNHAIGLFPVISFGLEGIISAFNNTVNDQGPTIGQFESHNVSR